MKTVREPRATGRAWTAVRCEPRDETDGGSENGAKLTDGDVGTLEAAHRRQFEWVLDRAEEAKEATRL